MNEKESKAVEFKRGDQVVLIPSNDADTTDIFKIKKLVDIKFSKLKFTIHCESKNHYYIELSSSIRHATPAEIAAGHRIDHPCTPCPNFTNDTCCHSTAKPLHKVAMKVWGRI